MGDNLVPNGFSRGYRAGRQPNWSKWRTASIPVWRKPGRGFFVMWGHRTSTCLVQVRTWIPNVWSASHREIGRRANTRLTIPEREARRCSTRSNSTRKTTASGGQQSSRCSRFRWLCWSPYRLRWLIIPVSPPLHRQTLKRTRWNGKAGARRSQAAVQSRKPKVRRKGNVLMLQRGGNDGLSRLRSRRGG